MRHLMINKAPNYPNAPTTVMRSVPDEQGGYRTFAIARIPVAGTVVWVHVHTFHGVAGWVFNHGASRPFDSELEACEAAETLYAMQFAPADLQPSAWEETAEQAWSTWKLYRDGIADVSTWTEMKHKLERVMRDRHEQVRRALAAKPAGY